MSQYKLRKNTNTELWVNINYVEHQHRTMSQYKLRRNTNTELWVNINYVGIPTQNWEPINYRTPTQNYESI